ncbi:polysaccharide polymerase [Romboutsia sp.]|uniref:polysaccharide polymerase n=1 Tax=Romboutsia sp. TaxID=1965302 RepID=UPI003F2DBF6D
MNAINKNESTIISKLLFVVTLIVILTRKYMISILRPDLPIDKITSLLFYGSIGLLFLQFLIRKRHNFTELIILGISIVLYLFTREGSILVMILLAISVRDINDSYVVKSYMLLNVAFIIGCILMGNLLTDIAQVPEVHYRFERGMYIQRETFGFGNPNSVFLFLLPIFAGYIYLRFDKYNWIDRIILIATTFYIYNKTMSRTGFITILGALVFVDILRFIDLKKYPILGKGIKLMPIIFLIMSVLIGTVFSNLTFLNKALASRPLHWKAYLIEPGSMFTLFGNKISSEMKSMHPLDSSYIYILAILGIVSVIFFMYLLYKGLDLFIKENNKKYIAIVVMFLVYALAENILFEVGYNFTIVLLLKYIMNNNPKNFTVVEGFKYITKRK